MMKQKRWLIEIGILLVLVIGGPVMLASMKRPFGSARLDCVGEGAGGKGREGVPFVSSADSFRIRRDTIRLPSPAYSAWTRKDSLLLPGGEADSAVFAPLQAFFAALDSLQAGKDTVVAVVHLGDSHIQAGHYSGRMMRLMQQQFGNAGRGWIAPFKLSKTNEPDDYFISSVIREWVAGRCVQNTRKTPIGIGGIGIQTVSPSINFDISIAPANGAGYAFNQAVLYRGDKSMPMLPAGVLKDSVRVFRADTVCAPGVLADTFRIACLADTLQLHSSRRKQGTNRLLPASSFTNLYYGFSLTNGSPGILYHSVGVNGAMFVHYTDEAYMRQLALLKPSLLIVSLGTNETFGRRFTSPEFAGQIRRFVGLVKKYMPQTCILLTTPPECYKRTYVKKKRTYVRNENTHRAAQAIVEAARQEGVACWDLFTATGGKNSCRQWHSRGWMGRDRIHFTKEGYQEQGTLLYRALMQTYGKWLSHGKGRLREGKEEENKNLR